MAGSVPQPVRSIIAPSKLRQIGSSTEPWKFAWLAHTALESRNREMSVLDVAGIRGLSLVSDKCFENQQPSWADRRQSPTHRSGRLRHKGT